MTRKSLFGITRDYNGVALSKYHTHDMSGEVLDCIDS